MQLTLALAGVDGHRVDRPLVPGSRPHRPTMGLDAARMRSRPQRPRPTCRADWDVLSSYAPVLVFLAFGLLVGVTFAVLNVRFGARRTERTGPPTRTRRPAHPPRGRPARLRPARPSGGRLFIALLAVAFVYEWRRGALDWVGEDRDA